MQELEFQRVGRGKPGQYPPSERRYYRETNDLMNVADNSDRERIEGTKKDW